MSESAASFPAFIVRQPDGGEPAGQVEWLSEDDLPAGDVLIDVACSSLNYKDALASRAHPGVVRNLPHVPGIDCAGVVLASDSPGFSVGDSVLVTGYGLGSDAWGGYSARVRVPAGWVVPMPDGMSAETAMTYGTAGFTAAQSVDSLLRHGVAPNDGPVLVTGATGGVGVFAVAILARLGFEVVAMSGKTDWADRLSELGAARVVGREALAPEKDAQMLKAEWAGGVDTVGGQPLANLVKSTRYRGCVACCGLVAGVDLPLSVYPFILRGVTLDGIDSAKCPREPRLQIWQRLAGPWAVELPESLVTTIDFDALPERIERMFAGQTAGRTLVVPRSASC